MILARKPLTTRCADDIRAVAGAADGDEHITLFSHCHELLPKDGVIAPVIAQRRDEGNAVRQAAHPKTLLDRLVLDGTLCEIFGKMAGRGCRAAVAAHIHTRTGLVSFKEFIDQGGDRLKIGLFEQLDRALDMFAHSLDDRTH